MKRLLTFFFVLVLCLQGALSVCAGEIRPGQVLYATDFADYTSLRDTGVRFGTLSGEKARMRLENGELSVTSEDGEKTYLLLPDTGLWTDTYVMEFVFRFTEIESSNGYCGLILSSRGDAPSGRSELIFRADGSIDGYKEKSDALKNAAEKGTPIIVRIHVTYGFLVDFQLIADGEAAKTYTPEAISRVSSGGRGFVLRNASASFASARVVCGEYGDLADAPDAPSYVAPDSWQFPEEIAPPTGDGAAALLLCAGCTAVFLLRMRRRV
ncbi:MAG: hypothetical protein IJD06_05420 [Clostridia bacterium]|nr:hypothetical protein [Clostridia bacterium]